ncbi:unnamed protein product [marine sediment metagenome]|uniref:Uncharacterized protein n=1 Tax=marine sediment metagenome TaxID=412755 RepID=X1M6M2_9ZZZZ
MGKCKKCHKQRAQLSYQKLCQKCSADKSRLATEQMRNKQGSAWEKWKLGMKKYSDSLEK